MSEYTANNKEAQLKICEILGVRWENCELVAESLCLMDDDESFCNTCKEMF